MKDASMGNIVIFIIVGDDYQLPGITEGALKALISEPKTKMTQKGMELIKECTNCVLSLNGIKRIKKEEQETKELIQRVRLGNELPDKDVTKIMNLHLRNVEYNHGPGMVEEIKKKSIYLFYRNYKRAQHNLLQLSKDSSKTNPVAIIKLKSEGKNGIGVSSHFRNWNLPSSSLLCIGSKVALEGKNFRPNWGLHNGACGIVEEIIFEANNNPNFGDLPSYVVVSFPQYKGPIWDKNSIKSIPVPIYTISCSYQCCKRYYLPLTLAYGRTIHKFQGLQAGPVEKGKTPNTYQCIICDPDDKSYESSALGLFYTAISRATTLGDYSGIGSAIYFTGSDMNEDRFRHLKKKPKGDGFFELAIDRDLWCEHLKLQEMKTRSKLNTSQEYIQSLITWASETNIPYAVFSERNMAYCHAKAKLYM